LRRAVQDGPQLVEECPVHLGHAVVSTLVMQTAKPTSEKTSSSSPNGGDRATEYSRHLVLRTSGSQRGQDQIPERRAGVSGPASRTNKLFALGDTQVRYVAHRGSPWFESERLSNATFDRETLVFNFLVAPLHGDRQFRTVI